MECASCGTALKQGARFCPKCGYPAATPPIARVSLSPQEGQCRRCHAAFRPGARFCPACGLPARTSGQTVAPVNNLPCGDHALCSSCHAPLKPGKRFCGACGAPSQAVALQTMVPEGAAETEVICLSCGTPLREGASSCGICGARVGEAQVRREAPVPSREASAQAGHVSSPVPTAAVVTRTAPPPPSPMPAPPGPAVTGSEPDQPRNPVPELFSSFSPSVPRDRRRALVPVAVAFGGLTVLSGLAAGGWWIIRSHALGDGKRLAVQQVVPLPAQFVGAWDNEDKLTRGITQVIVRQERNRLEFSMKDKAYPEDTDRGTIAGAISADDGTVGLQWSMPAKRDKQTLRLLPDGKLKVSGTVQYLDGSCRLDRDYDEYFVLSSKVPPSQASVQPAPEQAASEPLPLPVKRTPKIVKPKPGEFVEASNLDRPPAPLSQPMIVYTAEAISNQIRGTFELQASVDQTGKVTAAKVVSGPQPDFGMGPACVQGLMGIPYSIPMKEGVPVSTQVTYLLALNPPPLPKPIPQASASLMIESKAHVQRFTVQIDGQMVFDAPMAGAMGNDVRANREVPVSPGAHHFAATATFASGRTIQAQWDQTFQPGQQSVFNVWVPVFGGSIKMKRLQ